MKRLPLLLIALLAVSAVPAATQQSVRREFTVEPARAMSVTREILVRRGYEVMRVEMVRNDRVVYYRRGNMGRGKGKGPLMKLTIRRVANRVVFVDTPDAIMADVRLKLR